jgi:SET domain-containing protein
MALLEKYLYVKKSMLPNAGKGLFTKVAIPKATRIAEYKGKLERWVDVRHEEENGTNMYLLQVSARKAINAKNYLTTLARYANDARGTSKVVGLRNNCELVSEGDRCYIESLRSIKKFEEILVGYGTEYWALVKRINGKSITKSAQKQAGK